MGHMLPSLVNFGKVFIGIFKELGTNCIITEQKPVHSWCRLT
jgi:hypothetical protein